MITLDKSGQLVFDTELSLLRLLPEHRNIPRLYGHYVTKHNKGCIVMEYLPFPSLKSFVESSGALNEGDAVFILKQLVQNAVSSTSIYDDFRSFFHFVSWFVPCVFLYARGVVE